MYEYKEGNDVPTFSAYSVTLQGIISYSQHKYSLHFIRK
jgi:hypothetical protein